ncbi:MAG: GAF domain-containing sensor histidine kinase [Myxococcales bacterium]|nr:GAF domain-containing sensor histidine kinase [Myxococcales bacterium]
MSYAGSATAGGSVASVTLSRYLDALLDLNLASAKLFDPGELARVALDRVIHILGAERAFLFRVPPGGEDESAPLTLMAGRDAARQDVQELTAYSSTVVDQVRRERAPLVVTGTHEGAVLGSESAVAHDLRSIMAVPVQFRDQLVGVVYADTRVAEGFFTREDVDILAAIATHIAISLETAQSAQALRVARDQALESSRIKGQFLLNMSHELRTPLNAVIGYAELLLDISRETGFTDFNEELRRIGDAAEHLLRLISDILDITRSDAGRVAAHLEQVELAPLLDVVRSIIGPAIERAGNQLELRCPPALALTTDRTLLQRVLTHLVENANKFTARGDLTVTAALAGPEVAITIADTGVGIGPDELARVFEDFYQVDMSSTRAYGGLGVGLAICQRLVALLGGRITAESERGVGSRFTVLLPRAGPGATERVS